MANLILHIGMNKTGSTAIQSSLSAPDANDSFLYPDLGAAPSNHHTDSLLKLFLRTCGQGK